LTNHPEGAVSVSRALYEHGVGIFLPRQAGVARKPGVLLSAGLCQEILDRSGCGHAAGARIVAQCRQSELRFRMSGLLKVPDAALEQARMMLDRARWAPNFKNSTAPQPGAL
jgi:hypothetical protein